MTTSRREVKSLCLVLIVMAICSTGCDRVGEEKRRAFLRDFVASLASGTPYYEEHVAPGALREVQAAASQVSASFELLYMDHSGFQPYAYRVRFENGTEATFWLSQRGDVIRVVNLVVSAPKGKGTG